MWNYMEKITRRFTRRATFRPSTWDGLVTFKDQLAFPFIWRNFDWLGEHEFTQWNCTFLISINILVNIIFIDFYTLVLFLERDRLKEKLCFNIGSFDSSFWMYLHSQYSSIWYIFPQYVTNYLSVRIMISYLKFQCNAVDLVGYIQSTIHYVLLLNYVLNPFTDMHSKNDILI